MKKLYLILFIFLIINNVLAFNLKISPTRIEFNASVNEKVCNKIFISTDYRQELIGNDRWTKSLLVNKKDIVQYNKKAEELGLKLEYAEKIIISDDLKKEIEVCLTAEKPGKYNGALIYNGKDSIAGVGIWIFADIYEEKSYFDWISTKAVKTFSNLSYEKTEDMLIFLLIILFGFLIILIIIKKKQDRKKRN